MDAKYLISNKFTLLHNYYEIHFFSIDFKK